MAHQELYQEVYAYTSGWAPFPTTRLSCAACVRASREAVLEVTCPRRMVVVAVDGVAPRAKMAQQRTRRFLAAYVQSVADAAGAWAGALSWGPEKGEGGVGQAWQFLATRYTMPHDDRDKQHVARSWDVLTGSRLVITMKKKVCTSCCLPTEKEVRREMVSEAGGDLVVPHISRFGEDEQLMVLMVPAPWVGCASMRSCC